MKGVVFNKEGACNEKKATKLYNNMKIIEVTALKTAAEAAEIVKQEGESAEATRRGLEHFTEVVDKVRDAQRENDN
jgi:hypothetical protein